MPGRMSAFLLSDSWKLILTTLTYARPPPRAEGVLQCISYTGMRRPTESGFWSSWLRTGYPFQRHFFRTGCNISNAWQLQFCTQPFQIIQGQIALKNDVQCVNKQTVVLLLHSIKKWPIYRTVYQFSGKFFLELGANLESRAAHSYPKNTQSPPGGARSYIQLIFFNGFHYTAQMSPHKLDNSRTTL